MHPASSAAAGPPLGNAVNKSIMSAKEIIEAALKLDPVERARLADTIWHSPDADKQLAKLDGSIRVRVAQKIDALA